MELNKNSGYKMSMVVESVEIPDLATGNEYDVAVTADTSRHGKYTAILKNTGDNAIKYKILVSGGSDVWAEQVAEATLASGASIAINKDSIADKVAIQAKNSVADSASELYIFFKLIPVTTVV